MERVWVYARIPYHPHATLQQRDRLLESAAEKGWRVVGSSMDVCHGWRHRPGLALLQKHIRKGEVDRVYIESMDAISGRQRHVIAFLREMMQYHIKVQTIAYQLAYKAQCYGFGEQIETRALRQGLEPPWD